MATSPESNRLFPKSFTMVEFTNVILVFGLTDFGVRGVDGNRGTGGAVEGARAGVSLSLDVTDRYSRSAVTNIAPPTTMYTSCLVFHCSGGFTGSGSGVAYC